MALATPLYAGLLALLFIALSARVIVRRGSAGISLGDGGDAELQRRIRAHANFAEYAPVTLLLLLMAELQGAPAMVVHGLGFVLLAGRALHALGLSREVSVARVGGMVLTLTMLGVTALAAIGHSLF